MVGPNVTLDKNPPLDTTNSSVDIDLIGIAKNNSERSAAVALMSYNTMENLLKPDFFNTPNDTVKTLMSTVISATLPKTTNTKLTKPVNFTLKHIRELDPSGSLSCVYWNISEWIVDGCSVLKTNSNYTVCSCVHLSTFALMQTSSRPSESYSLPDMLTLVCVIVGLVFFSVALLIFVLCKWSPIYERGCSGCVGLAPEGYVKELRLGQSISKTAALVGCSRSAVVSIYQKCSKEGTVVNRRQGHGRVRLIDSRRLTRVVRSIRRATGAQIAQEVNAGSDRKVSEYIVHHSLLRMELHSRRPVRVPMLSPVHRQKR
ncbi:Adhesion G protein-coupled receptor E4 [Anabarilius grahami]|uniref:Adhesion G protein-coupled receptor E4 n=1 Tax=Anabarilius grahami TaxID=495550 RepID=A0A3N0XKU2_ANAGA|nr:Adhesion G protein-coupled receptor E4 [Anabarilius grahami]